MVSDFQATAEQEKRYQELQLMALDFARHGETDELRAMVEAGMPVNLSDEKGQSLLMLASYNGHYETTSMLLNHGADVDRKNSKGQTPLGGAAFKGETRIVELLVEWGADMEANNGGGLTPIMYAALFGRHETVERLKSLGASLATRSRIGVSAQTLVGFSTWISRCFSSRKQRNSSVTDSN